MLPQHLERNLRSLTETAAKRERHLIDARSAASVTIAEKPLISFCSNDYLNLSSHPDVTAAAICAIQTYGTGSTASAAVSGYLKPHHDLELAFADYLECDACVLFPSGYHANLAILSTFANKNSLIVSDKLIHASLIDGIQLSRAEHKRFPHQDYHRADSLLSDNHCANKLLVTESVFSMEGDITHLKELSSIAKSQQAGFIIDHAHGIGVTPLPINQNDYALLNIPLGKALASQGAIVAGKKEWIEPLLQFARTYRYTTALNPAASAAALAALTVIQQDNERTKQLQSLIHHFIAYAKQLALPLISDAPTPIKSILIGDNQKTLALQTQLMARGFFVSCIRPPTVPKNTARIRITLTAAHTNEQITQLLDTIARLHHEYR